MLTNFQLEFIFKKKIFYMLYIFIYKYSYFKVLKTMIKIRKINKIMKFWMKILRLLGDSSKIVMSD